MNPELKFDEEFYTSIKMGFKIQTIRNHLKIGILPGKKCNALFVNNNCDYVEDKRLYLKIKHISLKNFKDLDLGDVLRENTTTVEDLKENLLRIYPELNSESIIYCINFQVIKSKEV